MTDTADRPPLAVGLHPVDAPCPRCGLVVEAYVYLSTALTTPLEGIPSLRLKAQSKAVEHDCRHGSQSTVAQMLRDGAGLVVGTVDVDEP